MKSKTAASVSTLPTLPDTFLDITSTIIEIFLCELFLKRPGNVAVADFFKYIFEDLKVLCLLKGSTISHALIIFNDTIKKIKLYYQYLLF